MGAETVKKVCDLAMAQGNVKMKAPKKGKKKTNNQKKTHREGLVKPAKKGGHAKTQQIRMKAKMNKKLTGQISGHIEQLMMARVAEDRGETAPSSLQILKKQENYETKKEKKKRKK